jgi:hypothetical protein
MRESDTMELTFDDAVPDVERAEVRDWAARQQRQALWVTVRREAISIGGDVWTRAGESVIVRRHDDLRADLDGAYAKIVAILG